ncbi:prolyl 4-hydroxylase subunit alpha-1-like isoform X2 [Sycon ciliatum]|uniref:prolyl 4-hydroxylase subunit alpha-1-like isoform X2 n=1 Tax=Sycon ciliatum TaxID=27933 RepID=UPI0031F6B56C|eukprot:scpid58888/ scgid3871/ Prolyl 4-hydroxylase subunit alpha-1; Procollagen-proline,2-oxoglutarate-4-dioxygenase subunit alpha-1
MPNQIHTMLSPALLVLLSCLALGGNAETFTAVTHFKSLISLEQDLSAKLQAYISAEERELEKLKKLSEEVQSWTNRAKDDYESHLGHPTNAFRLVRRFTSDWREVENVVNNATDEKKDLLQQLETSTDYFPDEEDLTGAVVALMRLQDVYHVNTTRFADGLAGSTQGAVLTVEDLYLVGRSAYNKAQYQNCKKWMQEAIRRLDAFERVSNATKDSLAVRESLYDHLSFSEYKLGNVRRAYRLAKILVQMDPDSGRYLSNEEQYLELVRKAMFEEARKRRSSPQEPEPEERKWKKPPPTGDDDLQYWRDFEYYKKYCRESVEVSPFPDHEMICFYENNNRNPRLILNPVKVEVVTVNPTLLIYRDVLYDSEIEKLKQLADPKLNRATAHNRATGRYEPAQYRISKSAWLGEYLDESGVLAHVNQRIEAITDLSMSTAEELQVVNYGIGGHYEPHFDFARDFERKAMTHKKGNRIATLLFYMSDVSAGGCTVFPRIPARVEPSKGDASFWYNLLPSGDGDIMTRHAGCPVLSGSKWVCNKWIHEHDQEFRKPCKLTRDATWDVHLPPDHL